MFEIGDRVSLKNNPNKCGVIKAIIPRSSASAYEVTLDNGTHGSHAEHDLQREVVVRDSWELLEANISMDYRNFSISTTLQKVRNSTANTISTLKASKTIFKAYQYKPLLKFLRSERKRILIADEVGLGKTIEAGHILLELAARGEMQNALIICSKSLGLKWKTEMYEKFNFVFKIYENTKQFIDEINDESQVGKKSIKGIVTYAKCRNEELQKTVADANYDFDLVICDEAHMVRNINQQSKGVSHIVERSSAALFLTATPIMTELNNLYRLLSILDPERYEVYDIFYNSINLNKPFIKALRSINNGQPFSVIAHELEEATCSLISAVSISSLNSNVKIKDLFKGDLLFQKLIRNLKTSNQDIDNLIEIKNDIMDLNSLNHIYTRTRKRDVLKSRIKRKVNSLFINLSEDEQDKYNSIIDDYSQANKLALITKKRKISSCIPAYDFSRDSLLSGEFNQDFDSKYKYLREIISEVVEDNNRKIIVFAFFTNTLLYLRNRLISEGLGCELIYGGTKERQDRIDHFKNNPKISILLSSEVGSEGIDLQFCDALVNYDLPWNPMKVEQRIGRIDRIGQESAVINIYNLIIKGSIEEKIFVRLLKRINLFKQALGDLEEILGRPEFVEGFEARMNRLYTTQLSETEKIAAIDQEAKAIEQEKYDLNRMSAELQNAFAKDLHFDNEVDRILKGNRYLSQIEIKKYVESILRIELPFIHLKEKGDNLYILESPNQNKSALFDFIEEYNKCPVGSDLFNQQMQFKKKLNDRRIQITFDQEYAFQNKSIEYISAFHPLINAISNYFENHGYDKNQAHQLALDKQYCGNLDKGFYFVAISGIYIVKKYNDHRSSKIEFLKSTICDLNSSELQLLDDDLADEIYGALQLNGQLITETIPTSKEIVNHLRPLVMSNIMDQEETIVTAERLRFKSHLMRRRVQELPYLEKKIKRAEELYELYKDQSIGHIRKSELERFKNRKSKILQEFDSAKIESGNRLISLNIFEVI